MKKLLILILFFSQAISAQQLSWPEITRNARPWTRWWWPGSIVSQADLTAAMQKYKDAGLGGLELTVIYGVKGEEDKFINYLSPKWMDMFTYTLKEGERLGIDIDLANASGWPFGGRWVDPADACRNINYKTYSLKGGQILNEKIEFIQAPLLRAVGQRPEIASLIDPVGKNKDLQLYALDQIRFEKSLPVHGLFAYSDSGKVINLTSKVTSDKTLDWIAPAGNWTLYALFEGWHGKQVERAGPGGEGDVIDHFSGQAINDYLKHFDEAFKGYDVDYLHGYFNDSYEVDDASGQSNWTDNMFYEFYLRRGYDLSQNLPALFQKDTPEKNARVLSDYRQTISDLLVDNFTTHWTSWAHKQGKMTRDQAHGSPGNILDMYAASDIPETEGSEITRFKFASSASNVTGKYLTSCEAATWLGEHFTSTLADVKKAADQFFLGGVNHISYHGTCFSPQNEPWPGFLFYAAVELTPVNPLWNDFRGLNDYITRVQSFLQTGRPDNQVLLYFPIFDRYADYGRGMLEHFDAISPAFNGTSFKTGADLMLAKGYSFDYISDLQLKNTETDKGVLMTEGNNYQTLVLPGCKYIPIETFTHILMLANKGAKIIICGDMPENIAGWADLDAKNEVFNQLKNGINFSQTNNPEVVRSAYGKGIILMGNDLDQLLSFAGIKRETMSDSKISYIRRETKTGFTYFIHNSSDKSFDGWLPVQVKASSAALFNPMTEQFGTAKIRTAAGGATEVYSRLSPGESLVLSINNSETNGKPYSFFDQVSAPAELAGSWKVSFLEGGPAIPSSKEIAKLTSWTLFGGDDVKNFSGTASYMITFRKPKGKADAWMLNLGKVCESARVMLNGKEIAVLIGPEFKVAIDNKQLKSSNILEVRVSNLMANRISYMDRNNIEWKKFYNVNFNARMPQNTKNRIFDASSWQPKDSGLLGPVTISPMKVVK
ncbi:MAG TPA: glycosyl hydrolase [Bacteroidales bacterium]|nr:glycosyl hydrolase [Bacteroidales bacterium]